MSRSKRISKELEDVKRDVQSKVTLILVDEDLTHLKGTFIGPPGTPYEGGLFEVDIKIPDEYPFKPPIMKFDTRVYHPNISSQTGAICLDILKDAWTPILTLKSSLISLQSLLQSPEPSDPQDAMVAEVYVKNLDKFNETAKNWTRIYAPNDDYKGEGGEFKHDQNKSNNDGIDMSGLDLSSINLFVDMGFDKVKVIQVMRKLNIEKVRVDDEELQQRVIDEILNI
ncbi:E2 ubiquitin-conjugating protein [Martiniozyma asiatica (nom. inval.)]|nr:E2 ubiquitin-conjugating protein [Martiniozyma asiatica]